jgi:hypothetical protein
VCAFAVVALALMIDTLIDRRTPRKVSHPLPSSRQETPRPPRQPIPYTVRRAVLARSRGHCEDCGSTGIRLELHHLTYRRDGMTIFGRERPSHLVALCRGCHHARHHDRNGRFWSDPEAMAVYWNKRAFAEVRRREVPYPTGVSRHRVWTRTRWP